MTLKIKLKSLTKQRTPWTKYNLEMLKDSDVLDKFQASIGGKFASLFLLEYPQEIVDSMTRDLNETAEDILGKARVKRQLWIIDNTLTLCGKRRKKPKRH